MSARTQAFDSTRMQAALEGARAETMRLFALAADEADLRRPPAPGFRPILWHLGHIGAYEAYWLLQHAKGDPSPSPRFESLFDPVRTPREDASNLPPREEIDAYLAGIRASALEFLHTTASSAHWYTFHLVLEHELQHQETLLFLLHLLDGRLARAGAPPPHPAPVGATSDAIEIPAGSFTLGSAGFPFAYDNEQAPHEVELAAFRIDRCPVTNGAFAEFVDEGGYLEPRFWSEEGWAWREREGITRPYSWVGEERRLRGLFGERPFAVEEPVWGVSWHEAEAYARWAGRRLPTEAEWERAARGTDGRRFPWGDAEPDDALANFGARFDGPTPVGAFSAGASPDGVLDLAGNVWEWTATDFGPYPGFRSFPYPEYSELWFDGDHRVARGGSWATRGPILRSSFRNFYRRHFRIGFIGFRLAG